MYLFPLASENKKALTQKAKVLLRQLQAFPQELRLRELCMLMGSTKEPACYRAVLPIRTKAELHTSLEALSNGSALSTAIVSPELSPCTKKLFLCLPGMGTDWSQCRPTQLLQQKAFAATLNELESPIHKALGLSVHELLSSSEAPKPSSPDYVLKTHTMIFAMHICLAKQLTAMGLQVDGLMSFSVGELPAGYLSGAYSLEQAVEILKTVAQTHQAGVGLGRMLVVIGKPIDEVKKLLIEFAPTSSIGAQFAATGFALASPLDELQAIETQLSGEELFTMYPEHITLPYHSPLLKTSVEQNFPTEASFRADKTKIPWFSSIHGRQIQKNDLHRGLWEKNVLDTAHSYLAIQAALETTEANVIELNTQPLYARSFNDEAAQSGKPGYALPLFSSESIEPLDEQMLRAVAEVFVYGSEVNWQTHFGVEDSPTQK